MRIGIALLAFLTGCPMCDCDADVEIVDDDGVPGIRAGEVIQLRAHGDGWTAGPRDCDGHWYVNGFEGGAVEVGKIDSCGLYRAPPLFPPQLVELRIEAMEHAIDSGCADCCPYAYHAFSIDRTGGP